jgi:hypothetical protein
MKGDAAESAFRPLRDPYEKRFYWWEVVALLRRTLLVALIVFLADSRRVQLIAVGLECLLALLVHRELMPYRPPAARGDVNVNYVELAVLSFHLGLAVLLFGFEQPFSEQTATFLAVLVLIPSLALLTLVAVKAMRRLRSATAVRRLTATRLPRRRPRHLRLASLSELRDLPSACPSTIALLPKSRSRVSALRKLLHPRNPLSL